MDNVARVEDDVFCAEGPYYVQERIECPKDRGKVVLVQFMKSV